MILLTPRYLYLPRPQTFVCFHCPLVASAEAKSLLAGKNCYIWQNSKSVAHIWRDNVRRVGESSLGGRF